MNGQRRIDEIHIGQRFRKELGNIESLAADIDELGLLQPIVVHPDGRLIAGHRRLEACRLLGHKTVPVRVVDLADIVRGEASENFARKDFTLSEAVAIKRALEPVMKRAAEERMKAGQPCAKLAPGFAGKTRDKVAVYAGIGHTSLAKAEAIVAAAEAEPERFRSLVENMDRTGRVDRAFKLLKIARAREAYEARQEKGGTVADLVALAASGWRASTILADPPWLYLTRTESGKVWTSADNHFKPMSLEEIIAFGERYVLPLAARDCLLFLWIPWPLLLVVGQVMVAWGFEYSTEGLNWLKLNKNGEGWFMGNGYWTRSNSEVCLLGVRGEPLRLAEDVHQVITAPVGEHSEKPDEVHARIERLVAGPYFELFARKPRPGWVTYGDEIPWHGPTDLLASPESQRDLEAALAEAPAVKAAE